MSNTTYLTSKKERFSYGGYFLGQNLCYAIQFQFLTYFYTEEVGLSLGTTATLLLVARLWDAFNDPVMGSIVDKLNFKSGKYLFWLRGATYLVPLSMIFVFFNLGTIAATGYTLKLVFAYVTYILWGMLYTTTDAPLFSMALVMTNNVKERDVLITFGRFAAALAAVLSAAFLSLKGMVGWTAAVGVYMVFAFVVMLPLQFNCKERMQYPRSEKISIFKIFSCLFKNKYLMIYYLGYFAISIVNTLQPMASYFCNSNLGDEGKLMVVMGLSVLPVMLVAPFIPNLIQKLGKKMLTIYCCCATIILCVVQYFVGYDNFIVFVVLTAFRVLTSQLPLLIYGMFTSDCVEYGASKTGERTEGIVFSTQTMVTKLSGTLCNTLCLALMAFSGYAKQSQVQTPQALETIWQIMTILPIIGYAIMIIIMVFFYKLSEDDVQKLIAKNAIQTATN